LDGAGKKLGTNQFSYGGELYSRHINHAYPKILAPRERQKDKKTKRQKDKEAID
jgi:uncharacterized C2H2 Zn-finger protein